MKTVSDRVGQYGPSARSRFVDLFEKAEVSYPPHGLVLVVLKQERRLEVYAKGSGDQWRFIRSYPIKAASGQLGPKLREGDCQVPEGFYAIESLNPNSSFHLALRVGYPNATDKAMAKADGRLKLGSDIMIHGDGGSIGCISISDEAVEEIFVMSAETGYENIELIVSPVDFRVAQLPRGFLSTQPSWVTGLYSDIEARLTSGLRRKDEIFGRFSIANSRSLGFARDRLRTATPADSLNRRDQI